MGWFARAMITSAWLVIGLPLGCAALANLGEGTSDDGDASTAPNNKSSSGTTGITINQGSSGSSGTSGSSGSSGGPGGPAEAGTDAAADAKPDTSVVCKLKVDGLTCNDKSECCSNGCNEAKQCHSCRGSAFDSCNPGDDAPCCSGLYCSTQTGVPTCQGCLGPGSTPRTQIVGGGDKSCCSRMVDGTTGKCK